MKAIVSVCAPHRAPEIAGNAAMSRSMVVNTITSQLRSGIIAALAVGILGTLAGLATPAAADQGQEWEPGGLLYKYLDRYDPRQKSRRRARVPVRAVRHDHDDDGDESYGSDHDHGYGDEPTSRHRRAARHRSSRRSQRRRATHRSRRRTHVRRTSKRIRRRIRLASLGSEVSIPSTEARPRKSVTGGTGVIWVARAGCLNARLRAAIHHVARTYGRVRVNSTCRSRRHNRRVGGARRSWHLSGNAADIRIWGNVRGAARYLRSVAGGYKHYGGGLFHIDTGPRRTW